MPTIVSGNFSFTRAAPHPANIRMYVPTTSAIAYTSNGGVRQQTLDTYENNKKLILEKIVIKISIYGAF